MTTFPTLDPELAVALTMLPKVDFTDLPGTRATYDALIGATLAGLSYDGVTLRELSAPGLDGDPEVTIRFFTPDNTTGPIPVLLWMHGGGFGVGTAEGCDPFCIQVARELGFAVANVEYRLAPETPFPGPLNDCYAALTYVHAHAEELGIDPSRIAVGGQSAGGGLAAGTVLKARDEGIVPVAFQFLEVPALDDRLTSTSMTDFVDTPNWHRPNAILSWQFYLGESYSGPEDPNVSIYAAPARATDLSNLPPAYVCTMELDPLRDEGIEYAVRLLQAGVSVELHSFPGTFHGSSLVATAEVSKRGAAEALTALQRGLRTLSPVS
ncbi:alpha/beta hydrolase [Rhodococcus sp. KBS0724]|uniref:alpha/beta hydrolase n=1 Tax=Rhodococcus sp. KBS0724 TaxID=1179674 RepID=UPI00110EA5DE|nr:alpha/beta hydrolase [Rhodococcus sp. KBS0724]TSD49890.1 alpha/beta hydrolase [Rhodococcus sp. KBS0724]